MIRPDTKRKTPAKLSLPVLKFLNKGSLYATAHEQSWSSFFYQDNPSTKVPTYAVLDDQSPHALFLTDSLLEQQEWKAKKWTCK